MCGFTLRKKEEKYSVLRITGIGTCQLGE